MIKCSQGRSSAPRTCSGLHCLNFHPVTNNQSFIIIIVLNKIHFYYHIALYNSFSFTCLDIDIHSKLFLSFQGIRCSWQAHDRLRSLVTVKKKAIKSFISTSFSETLGFKTTLSDPNPL